MAKNKPEYTKGQWKGMPKYTCNYCGWSTLHLNQIKSHIEEYHREKPERKPVEVPIYDRFGQLIKYREV